MTQAQWLIKIGVGITMLAFGLQQFLKPKVWIGYIPEWLHNNVPFTKKTKMRIHSLANIFVGIWLMLPVLPLVSAWIALIWWISILPFAFLKHWQVGLRDLSIVSALAALIFLL